MKKLIFMIAIAIISITAMAQTQTTSIIIDTTTVSQYSYCEIVGISNFLGTKVTIQLDFGQVTKFFEDNRYKDENGKLIKFNSMVDAMNWMGNNGWEFCQAYTITTGNQNVYYFLLKKYNSIK